METTSTSTYVRCDTWADHAWSGSRVVEVGRHAVYGTYQRVERRCQRCGRLQAETQWMRPQRATEED